MGGSSSKSDPAQIVAIAKTPTAYRPPLGAPNAANPLVYFDIAVGDKAAPTPLGRVLIEVKQDVCPRTAENFVQLAKASPGQGFKSSGFHRPAQMEALVRDKGVALTLNGIGSL
ncbi:peptidyl-prolyl cis-trans isomerase [Haematococcus lacustris]|uniref:Peptidyl-prolyl cis-trans isomerase n=1 Tax=Haematococcus lacustris TaxID=44745 RepID=A0A699YH50_HAELA|nr:peptidyl-prolyl cis-trans isomerase [Haematococcus lacustris]